MLLRRTASVVGSDVENCVLCDIQTSLVVVLGQPQPTVLAEALQRFADAETLISSCHYANVLTRSLDGWEGYPLQVHVLDSVRRPWSRHHNCRWLQSAEIFGIENATEATQESLLAASRRSRIAAAFEGRQPVSFCFTASFTQSFCSISVETLESYRRQGFGSASVSWMAERWIARGLRPVWDAAESNTASCAMAKSLGFVPAARLVMFRRQTNRI